MKHIGRANSQAVWQGERIRPGQVVDVYWHDNRATGKREAMLTPSMSPVKEERRGIIVRHIRGRWYEYRLAAEEAQE